ANENPRSPDRFGWTLWNGRTAEAWAGRTTLPEDPSGNPAPEGIRLVRRGAARVLSSVIGLRSAWKLEAEYLLQSPLETHVILPLPVLDRRDISRRVAVEPVFEEGEAQHAPPEGMEKGSPEFGGRPAGFTLVLRDHAGKPLLVARLRDEPAE